MNNNLKIIIPAAGIGKRLRPHTLTTPKPLLPVAGKPMLAHILDPLLVLNPVEVVFVIGHLGGQLTDYVKNSYNFKSTFIEQKELLGLGYAVNLALQQLSSGPTLIILSDTIARLNYEKFISSGDNVIGLKEVDDPRRFGIAITNNNKITEFEEKPKNPRSNFALIGLYYFKDSAILKNYTQANVEMNNRTSGEIQLTDSLELMVRDGFSFNPFIVDGWYDCGKVETILETNRYLLKETKNKPEIPGNKIIPPVSISSTAQVNNSTIGPNVTISTNTRVINSQISDSIICENALVEDCKLDKSLIGINSSIKGLSGSFNIGESIE